jgi:hypothetical protein
MLRVGSLWTPVDAGRQVRRALRHGHAIRTRSDRDAARQAAREQRRAARDERRNAGYLTRAGDPGPDALRT